MSGATLLKQPDAAQLSSESGILLPTGDVIAFPEWRTTARRDAYDGEWTPEQIAAGDADAALYDVLERPGNLLLLGGASVLWECLIGNGGTSPLAYFSNANAVIGVGNSTTTAAATQTDLQGSTSGDRAYKAMDASFPTHTEGTATAGTHNRITFKSTFGTSEGNLTGGWQEWVIKNAATFGSGRTLNRKVENLGTKVNTATWVLTVTIDLG